MGHRYQRAKGMTSPTFGTTQFDYRIPFAPTYGFTMIELNRRIFLSLSLSLFSYSYLCGILER